MLDAVGEVVVTTGASSLKDGTKVVPVGTQTSGGEKP